MGVASGASRAGGMTSQDFVKLALQLTTMLGCAVLFGEIMRRFRQPAVVGEMIGGIILGPTVFGWIAPSIYEWLFLSSASVTTVREAATKLGMLFFLFYAGLEINLSDLRTLGRKAVLIGFIGTVVPIAAGVTLVYALPRAFWGSAVQAHVLPFALFVGMNLANSANPVIARILMDLGLLARPIGALIMSATIVDDLVNWTLFAVILGEIAPSSPAAQGNVVVSALLVGLLFAVLLGLGRRFGPPALRWIEPHVTWPSGFIAVIAVLVLLASSASEALGVHAFLGAFLLGAAFGDTRDTQKDAHDVIGQFVASFAPIFFISMGMSANFISSFDPLLAGVILVAACVSKVGAVLAGARAAGMPLDAQAWAIAFGLNARGATGIILAGVGLTNGLIDARIFVAMVFMAAVTSVMAGPMMSRLVPEVALARVDRG
jgi:Kef-type K+ transport system membrane component KefB